MQKTDTWCPSKFVLLNGKVASSRDSAIVGVGSRFIVDLVGPVYAETLRTHARGKLLDLGCGAVPLFGLYRDLITDSVCVDWESSGHNLTHVDLFADLNADLPLPKGEFDTVIATDVLEHICRPDLFFSEMTRVLAPGGKLIIGVPFLYWIHEAPHDHHRYTEFRLRLFCKDNGLEVLEIHAVGGWMVVIIDLLLKRFARSRFLRLASMSIARLYKIWLGDSPNWQTESLQVFPVEYCLVARKPVAERDAYTSQSEVVE